METLELRYQELLQKRRESPDGNIAGPDYYELELLEALFRPEPKMDDLEDLANIARAAAKIVDHANQTILKHYYYQPK